jgi:hypothetical protein
VVFSFNDPSESRSYTTSADPTDFRHPWLDLIVYPHAGMKTDHLIPPDKTTRG